MAGRRGDRLTARDVLVIYEAGVVNRIEEAGWIERKAHPSDRRGSPIAMTEAVLNLVDEVLPLHVANEASILSCLDKRGQVALNESLRDLLAGLQRGTDRGPL